MRENVETLVIGIRCVCLQRWRIFAHQVPIFTVEQRCLHKNAVLVCGEVSSTNDLANKEDLWLEVAPSSNTLISALNVASNLGLCLVESPLLVIFRCHLFKFTIKFQLCL